MAGMGEAVLGHEVVGTVAATGSAVSGFEEGQRVTGLIYGGFADYAVAKNDLVIAAPDGISDEAVMGEPLSCMMSAIRRTSVDLGDQIALIGLGYMGLLCLMALRLRGAREIIAIDPREDARNRALALGADKVMTAEEVSSPIILKTFDEIEKDFGVDVVVEASGHPAALSLAGEMTKAHGLLSIVGYHQGGPRSIDMQMWNWKALSVLNAHERRSGYQMNCMKRGLDLIAAGRFDPGPLTTHRFRLDEVDRAFETVVQKPDGFVKAIVDLRN